VRKNAPYSFFGVSMGETKGPGRGGDTFAGGFRSKSFVHGGGREEGGRKREVRDCGGLLL